MMAGLCPCKHPIDDHNNASDGRCLHCGCVRSAK